MEELIYPHASASALGILAIPSAVAARCRARRQSSTRRRLQGRVLGGYVSERTEITTTNTIPTTTTTTQNNATPSPPPRSPLHHVGAHKSATRHNRRIIPPRERV